MLEFILLHDVQYKDFCLIEFLSYYFKEIIFFMILHDFRNTF